MDISEYSDKELIIDGLKTYIISPRHYEEFLSDVELFHNLDIRGTLYDAIQSLIENADQIREIKIELAVVLHENRKICRWEPVNVYEDVCHVFIRRSWMCRNCGHIHKGIIIMPMVESDSTFLEKEQLKNYSFPGIFKKFKCEKCGKEMQKHLYYIPR